MPDVLKNLFAVTSLKHIANTLGIRKLEANSKGGKIEFSDKPNVDPLKIIKLIQNQSKKYRLDGPTKLRFSVDTHDIKERIGVIENVLTELRN